MPAPVSFPAAMLALLLCSGHHDAGTPPVRALLHRYNMRSPAFGDLHCAQQLSGPAISLLRNLLLALLRLRVGLGTHDTAAPAYTRALIVCLPEGLDLRNTPVTMSGDINGF